MFDKFSIEGALNWATKHNKDVLMVVPNRNAMDETLTRLKKKYREGTDIHDASIVTETETSIGFLNGKFIIVLSEEYKDSFLMGMVDVMYVHPWCNHYSDNSPTISSALVDGGVVF